MPDDRERKRHAALIAQELLDECRPPYGVELGGVPPPVDLGKMVRLHDRAAATVGWTVDELEAELLKHLSGSLTVPCVELGLCEFEAEAQALIPRSTALAYGVVPIRLDGNALLVAMWDPVDLHLLDDLAQLTGKRIEPVLASPKALLEVLTQTYGLEP
jgi:Type II secretion system (T2SS), protein E, N-terminal domain